MGELIKNIGDVKYNSEMRERFVFPFSPLNYLLSGGVFGRLCIIYSKTDEGKTTLLSQILCYCVKQGFKCMVDFGEDTVEEATETLFKQYTPYDDNNYVYVYKKYTVDNKTFKIGEYHLTQDKWEEARSFFNDKLFVYDIMKDPNLLNIVKALDLAREKGCRIAAIDNLENVEAINNENENSHSKDVAITLRNYAVKYGMYIFLVCHTKKFGHDYIVPDIEDIKGSSAVANTAKDIIVILRTDRMDKNSKQYKQLKRLVELNNYDLETANGLILVQKTKGPSLGVFAVGYSKHTKSYYECKKIDPQKKDNDPVLYANTEDEDSKISLTLLDPSECDELPF